MNWGAVGTLSLLAWSSMASAAPGDGTVERPFRVDAFPYALASTTVGGETNIERYDCAPDLDESGPERIFAFELSEAAKVTAWVEGDGGGVDVDVHLLGELQVRSGVASGCAGRGNVIAEAELQPGWHHVVVDSYAGIEQAGEFVLRLHAIGSSWAEVTLAEGVRWRAKRTSADAEGGPQVLHVLEVDPRAPGVRLEVALPSTCETIDVTASRAPSVVAAVNSSFFASCSTPVSFMKNDGEVLAFNGGAQPRGALGWGADVMPQVARVAPGADWPEVPTGQGGLPLLASDGVPAQGDDAWAVEGLTSASFIGPNPRTIAGYDTDGRMFLGTVDGRRASAAGMSLDALARYGVEDLGAVGLVNLDGGGSTSMWVAGATPSGIVNYPSDGGAVELPDHGGARAVVGAVLVHADPYNHPPRFQTDPTLQAAVDEVYAYDVDAIDLDVDDEVTFELEAGPVDMTIDGLTGELVWSPPLEADPSTDVVIVAADDRGARSRQAFAIDVAGAIGPEPGGSTGGSESTGPGEGNGASTAIASDGGGSASSSGTDDGAASSSGSQEQGCGCSSSERRPGTGVLVFGFGAWIVGRRRRREPT